MICTTIQHKDLEEILAVLETEKIALAEIRLDRCPLSLEEIDTLFSGTDVPLVATCRVAGDGSGSWQEAEEKLRTAIEAGAAFADLEGEAPPPMGKRLRRLCSEYGTVMIRSAHFFDGTPSLEELTETALRLGRIGGEIVKIAATAATQEDADRVLALYGQPIPDRLIAFAMGPAGRESRLACLAKGAPFTYAALSEAEAAAPGQWACNAMAEAVYGSRRPVGTETPLRMPSSKSFAQRAIVAAALAEGTSFLGGYTPCGDNEAALRTASALGARIAFHEADGSLEITGIGAAPGAVPLDTLDVGESGLMTRLMIPLSAALGSGPVRLQGCGTLLRRPLKGAGGIMASFGTLLRPEGTPPVPGEVFIPLSVHGPLIPGKAEVSGKDGSQLISGLLMALPLLDAPSSLYVVEPKSIPYMFITTDVLRRFGIRIGSEMEGDETFLETQDWRFCTGIHFKTRGRQRYRAASIEIEGDWSAAANFLVAGAVFGNVRLEGLDTTSLQADLSIMDILMEAGAGLSQIEQEDHRGVITACRAPLRSFEADLGNCPDLFPIVAVLAAFCPGESRLEGVGRLRGKESDRAAAILEMLLKMGVDARIEDDALVVTGETLEARILNGRLLKGGKYTSSHDHRMVMALRVASLGADSPVDIDDEACVAKSFPLFPACFDALHG